MPFHRIPSDELRTLCRQKMETLEIWLRRLIDEEMTKTHGVNYIDTLKKDIKNHIQNRMANDPGRYQRPVDTLTLEYLIDILCRPDLYKSIFRKALGNCFPGDDQVAREYLQRLIRIRNALAHANPISVHDAERIYCYCDDAITSLKSYYEELGMLNEYNVPRFIRFSDSLGNMGHLTKTKEHLQFSNHLRPGDVLRMEVEVDATFDPGSYTIGWAVNNI